MYCHHIHHSPYFVVESEARIGVLVVVVPIENFEEVVESTVVVGGQHETWI